MLNAVLAALHLLNIRKDFLFCFVFFSPERENLVLSFERFWFCE